jgi:dihydrolipoamide dehydrogenase
VYDVVILGGGPGGYAAALYAHNFGLSVALIEKDEVGGTCLLRGCIPAKSWLQAAEVFTSVQRAGDFGVQSSDPTFDWTVGLDRKGRIVNQLVTGLKGLLKRRKVDVVGGFGRITGPGAVEVTADSGETQVVQGRNLIVATGSVPRAIPGYEFDGVRVVSSNEALDWPARPERVAIIGAGAIGSEFASLLADLGSEVHLFEMLDQIVPGAEPETARVLARAFDRKGIQVRTGVTVGPAKVGEQSVVVPFGEESVEVDVVLVAVGRAPVTDGIGLEHLAIELDRGFVPVDLDSMQTAEPGVYAVGDIVAGTPQLAHAGFAEGIAAVTHIATGSSAGVDPDLVPLVVYTHPELAAVGLTEARAKEQGYEVETAKHTFAGVGRAIIVGQAEGIVKIVSEKDGGRMLGASIAGPLAGEMIHELMLAVAWEALPAEAAAFVHAHPTISEAVGETLLTAAGRSLH